MAITQISRIKVRTGDNIDLPVLDSGEFGYSTDTRQLYIGNVGSLLPSDNTEILTEYSPIPAPGTSGELLYNNTGMLDSIPTATYNGSKVTLGDENQVSITGGSPGDVLTTDGSGNLSWGSGGNLTISDDTTTNASRYLLFTDVTSGSITTSDVASTKLYFNPSSGIVSATNFNSLSDANLKENIQPIDGAVETVNKLRGVGFQWKDGSGESYGVIAQELEKVLPELVSNADNQLSVNYAGLIGFLINAVKELDSRLKKLESGNQ